MTGLAVEPAFPLGAGYALAAPLASWTDDVIKWAEAPGGLPATDLVVASVFGLLGACAVILLTLFSHALYRRRMDRHNDMHAAVGRRTMAGALVAASPSWPQELNLVPKSIRRRLFIEAGRSLVGQDLLKLRRMAEEAGMFVDADKDCRSWRWWHRLPAARLYATLGGGASVMPALLKDPRRSVRVEAVRWCGRHQEAVLPSRLMRHLASDDGMERAVAVLALAEYGQAAVAPLCDFLVARRGTARQAALFAAEAIGDPALLMPALSALDDEAYETRLALARFLTAMASSAGEEPLLLLLRDSVPDVRAAAARGLAHLRVQRAIPALSEGMDDDNRDVRHAAGLALRAMGCPGLLGLRRVAQSSGQRRRLLADAILRLPKDAVMEVRP